MSTNPINEIIETISLASIPRETTLTDILLPNQWVLYLYDKQLFKKLANRPGFQAKPHKEICTISTLNDIIYILHLMGVKIDNDKIESAIGKNYNKKYNLDCNDYIIMRKGIEPIWEDPKNSNGGTFTIKMSHNKGYNVWRTFIMYMIGETLCNDMNNINGITVSYISDGNNFSNHITTNNNNYTYIKIWDGKSDRTRDEFINILPSDILNMIKNESLMYSQNNKKKDFDDKNIINKLHSQKASFNNYSRGGFRADSRMKKKNF